MTAYDPGRFGSSIAAYRLEGADPAPPPALRDDDWRNALVVLTAERLTGLAVAAAEDGWLELSEERFQELLVRHRRAMSWCLGLEARLLEIADVLDAREIPFLVLKGPALAHTVYADPSWRPFGDLDLLVRTEDWRRACAVFEEELGWPRRLPEPRRGFDERFGKSAVFRTETGQEIDLHRTLAQGPFGQWIHAEDLFDGASTFELAGRKLPRPDAAGLFVHACVHAVLGDAVSPIVSLRDVAGMFLALDDDAAVRALAQRWDISPVVGLAIHRTSGGLAWTSSTAAASEWPADPRQLRMLQPYLDDGRSEARMHLAMLRSIRGVRGKAAYVRDLVAPRRAFLEKRSTGRASYARRLATPVRWLAPRRSAK